MLKPICMSCHRFFRMHKAGFYFIEAMPESNEDGYPEPGMAQSDRWTPYKVWSGDVWRCEGCDAKIISGVGKMPVAEHYEKHFAATVQRLGVEFRVNDC